MTTLLVALAVLWLYGWAAVKRWADQTGTTTREAEPVSLPQPEGVRLVDSDGVEHPAQVVFYGYRSGIAQWLVVCDVVNPTRVLVTKLPGRTELILPVSIDPTTDDAMAARLSNVERGPKSHQLDADEHAQRASTFRRYLDGRLSHIVRKVVGDA